MRRRYLGRPQKPHLLKITPPAENSFVIKGDQIAWDNPWHFHPEIELLFCVKGKGTNYVGNYVAPIEEGELLLFGKNLPHTRQRDRSYYSIRPLEEPETIVVQFDEHFLGEPILEIREFAAIKALLRKAERGLKFTGATRDLAERELMILRSMNGLSAILKLLSILDLLSKSDHYTFLNPESYLGESFTADTQKINRVFSYVNEHFRDRISLSEAAELCNLTPASFCRYFKARTKRSFMEYVTQTRVSHACQLLMETNMDVTGVALQSGFNSMSNFQKQFKRIMLTTPSSYKETAMKRISSVAK